MLVEGDHNSRRPRYARDSAAIFLKTALRVPDSYAIPVHGMMMRGGDFEDFEEEEDEFEREDAMARQEQALIERAIQMSLREEEEKKRKSQSSVVTESTKEDDIKDDERVTSASAPPDIPKVDDSTTTTTSIPIPKADNLT